MSFRQLLAWFSDSFTNNRAKIDRLGAVRNSSDIQRQVRASREKPLNYTIREADTGKELTARQYRWLKDTFKDFDLFRRSALEPSWSVVHGNVFYENHELTEQQQAWFRMNHKSAYRTQWSATSKVECSSDMQSDYLGQYCEQFGIFTAHNKNGEKVAELQTFSMYPTQRPTSDDRIDVFHGRATFYTPRQKWSDPESFSIMFDVGVPLL